MSTLFFEDGTYHLNDGESVLECLEREGHAIPNACRSGVCHSCMLRATDGEVPSAAQKGLRPAQAAQGYFLSCCCYPEAPITAARGEGVMRKIGARLVVKEALNERVLRILLETEEQMEYFPGQFVNFVRADGLVRSFSVASVPALESTLEFHIALVPGGQMSGWLHHEAESSTRLELMGPLGNCFYVNDDKEQSLFLLGTGTGLAPLYGIVRDALHQGHTGAIHLFHGSLLAADLYLTDALRQLSEEYANFSYHACVRDEPGTDWMRQGDVDAIALETIPNLKGWKVYLCGNPALVKLLQRKTFLAGASMQDIYADAFIPAGGG